MNLRSSEDVSITKQTLTVNIIYLMPKNENYYNLLNLSRGSKQLLKYAILMLNI